MRQKTKIKWAHRLWHGLGRLPLWALHLLSDLVALVLCHLIRYRRDVVAHNLSLAFPDKSAAERKRIERDFYRYFCDTFLEASKMMTWTPDEMKAHFAFEGIEQIRKTVHSGKDFILYIGHYGQWEWIPSISLWLEGISCAQIYERLRDPIADDLMRANRQVHGSHSVEKHDTLRYMARMSKSGTPYGVGFVADQSPGADQLLHYETFFGQKVPVHLGAEKIAHRLGLTPFFLDLRRCRRGYWQVRVVPMSVSPDAPSLTTAFYQLLEEMIRRDPAYYLWTHKRFKYARTNNSVYLPR